MSASDAADPVRPALDNEPLFSIDSPIGPLEYRAGRGMHFGHTGLNIGGFSTVEFEDRQGEQAELALDNVNFLILLQPTAYVRGFAELEIDGIASWRANEEGIRSNPESQIERMFLDGIFDDSLTTRFGKFQTPFGRWNLVPAEPFVWTPEEPVVLENAFDEHQTGAAVLGTLYPSAGTVHYWLYGQFLGPLDKDDTPAPADHSYGARLQFDRGIGEWSLGASFLATEQRDRWSYMGGLDALWQLGRLELSSEAFVQRGALDERDLWSIYVQGVFETIDDLYLVGRFEHYDRNLARSESSVFDLGATWIPNPYLRFKAMYRLTDRITEDVSPGAKLSFSVTF